MEQNSKTTLKAIIFIGNGFDLAHGLKTRYEDFIDWYWTKRVKEFRECSKYPDCNGTRNLEL